MKLNIMGYNVKENENFSIARPNGSGDNLFLVFKTDAWVFLDNEKIRVFPNGCMIYEKGVRQLYRAYGKTFRNHYLHFDSGRDENIRELGLPLNRPFYLQNVEEIESVMRLLAREQISEKRSHLENSDLLIRLLLNKLTENMTENPSEDMDYSHREELIGLRSEIYSNPRRYSSIRELAEEVNLSLSHFQALYHTYFGISCYDDLLEARINGARGYLQNSSLQINEIAMLCGYENDTSFMRCFKRKTGMTPTQFRKRNEQ